MASASRTCFNYVAEFRKTNQTTPVVLMGYANPIERIGPDAFIGNRRGRRGRRHRGRLSAGGV
jgi:tryptophan synthase alpha subunit